MLDIRNKTPYDQLTALLNPTSTYEDNWNKDSKMLLVRTDETGKFGSFASEIFDNVPNRFISIRHYGIIQDNKRITQDSDVEKWANGF